jgi:hypothetical protein
VSLVFHCRLLQVPHTPARMPRKWPA